jgi:DNA-binding NtrC family response regulator
VLSKEQLPTRVLVVDDEEPVREVLSRRLKHLGYDVAMARTADEAMIVMESHPAQIAFVDLIMPGHDGLWLMEQFRERWPDTVVVVVSGVGDLAKVTRARALGAVDFVAKPIGREMLQQAVERAVTKLAGSG